MLNETNLGENAMSNTSRQGENYGQFLNLLELAMWLGESNHGVTLAEIAERFNVTRRTAERMRDALRDYFGGNFDEQREGTQKYFKLRAPRLDTVIRNSFSEEDLTVLPLAVQSLRQSNLIAQAETLERIRVYLMNFLHLENNKATDLEDVLRFEGLALRPGPRRHYNEVVAHTLRDALRSFHQVKVTYPGRTGSLRDYVLIPMGFLYGEREHYLVARHADGYGGGEPHHFKLSRIHAVEELKTIFVEDTSFSLAAHAARSFGVFQEKPVAVEWLFSPEAAAEAENYLFHPSQEMRRNPDGSLTVRFTAGGRLEMAWHLYTWGNQVKVVKPADFWESLPPQFSLKGTS